ncbi:hypothetical protein U9M73_00375 [Paenibacillus phoenicis]|uniref:Phage protein n=1 Tax=Paenibacillus phoenicis TaxID=554117 RepID=A0ABU5PEU5_9BACL|nr:MULTISPECIES: hypothetical protein [Paenibacillus]EES73632.1 hypothetical protein POTG_01927 [Paenibacillus sp. oral taxon 786 str. D14]MCT2193647.1 hypothetical protein [Paenibacillus sp. p3-SID1389]MEA3568454.1 hypothetical protein [Paenibacillus phoenicis]
MLTFEQKLEIFKSFPELEQRNVSLGRVNFHYEGSVYDKKTVVYHLHPNGNGFVYAGLLDGYETDAKGFVNIRDMAEPELRRLVKASITALSVRKDEDSVSPSVNSGSKDASLQNTSTGGVWANAKGEKLTLKYEDDLWYIYSGLSLEMAFETREEAGEYLAEEGFSPFKG